MDIAKAPTAAEITYGDTLNASALSGGTVLYGDGKGQAGDSEGNTVAVTGTFTWQEPATKPVAADSNVTEYTVVFAPSDTANYNPVEAKVTLTVNKVQNALNMPGSTMDVSNSLEKVGDVSLPEGWEWQDADKETALEVGMAVSAVAVYIGADKGNYENETVEVTITRSTCEHTEGEILYTGDGESEPTCTKEGLGHTACTKCGAVVREYITVSALGHDYDAGEVTKEPTLEDEGERKYTCKRCGHTYTETIPRKKPQGLWIDHMKPSMDDTGAAVRQEQIEVYYGTTMLREKVDYTISYSTSIKTAGTYEVTVSGKGNYTGSMVKTFSVKPRGTKLLKSAAVSGIKKSYTYPGSGLAADLQGVVVKMGKTTLIKGTDYTVRTENTDVVGTGTVIIEAAQTDAYAGEKRIAVNITGTDLRKGSIKGVEKSYPYTGMPITPQITVYSGRSGKGEVISADKYIVSYTNNTEKGKATVTATGIPEKGYSGSVKVTKRGTATILVRGKGAYSGVKRVTFRIVQKKIR